VLGANHARATLFFTLSKLSCGSKVSQVCEFSKD
jgi:hypothetical protein